MIACTHLVRPVAHVIVQHAEVPPVYGAANHVAEVVLGGCDEATGLGGSGARRYGLGLLAEVPTARHVQQLTEAPRGFQWSPELVQVHTHAVQQVRVGRIQRQQLHEPAAWGAVTRRHSASRVRWHTRGMPLRATYTVVPLSTPAC